MVTYGVWSVCASLVALNSWFNRLQQSFDSLIWYMGEMTERVTEMDSVIAF